MLLPEHGYLRHGDVFLMCLHDIIALVNQMFYAVEVGSSLHPHIVLVRHGLNDELALVDGTFEALAE